MIVKKHVTGDRRLVLAICDDALLGSVFEDDGKQLDLSADFFRGMPLGEEDVIKLIGKAYSVNAVGKEVVNCCIKAEVASKEDIRLIKGIPYLQLVFF
jgi:hypothetical protein